MEECLQIGWSALWIPHILELKCSTFAAVAFWNMATKSMINGQVNLPKVSISCFFLMWQWLTGLIQDSGQIVSTLQIA